MLALAAISIFSFNGWAFAQNSMQVPTTTPTQTSPGQQVPAKTFFEKAPLHAKSNLRTTKPTSWKFESEQEWLVDSIGRDVAEIILYAKHKDDVARFTMAGDKFVTSTIDKPANKYSYKLIEKPLEEPLVHEFALQEYVWSPTNYVPLAQKLIAKLGVTPDEPSKAPDNFLRNLADATSDSLFRENDRISAALSDHPFDAGLHEQAALLQAAFGLHECAGGLSDTRPPASRMAAHLALANALRGDKPPSLLNQIADIGLESLSCRDGIAVTKIDLIAPKQTDPIVQSILRALKIRSTGDFRIFKEKGATSLEGTQYGLRRSHHFGATSLMHYMEANNPQPRMSWMRLGLIGRGTVESGHYFGEHILSAELHDFAMDFAVFKKRGLKDYSDMSADLNLLPTRCLVQKDGVTQLQVLSWDDVAAFHARHIISAFEAQYDLFYRMWGIPASATETVVTGQKMLAGVTLLPVLLCRMHMDDAALLDFMVKTKNLFLSQPESLTAYSWTDLTDACNRFAPDLLLENPNLWFSPMMPMGTAYFFGGRYDYLDHSTYTIADLSRLRALCPSDRSLCAAWLKMKYGNAPTTAQMEEAYGPLMQFDIATMESAADNELKHGTRYIELMEKVAKYLPSENLDLGDYCVLNGRPEAAAKYYEKAWKNSEDAVDTANRSWWLTNYLYDHGRKADAIAFANFAEEVYSYRGIQTRARLFERMGNLKGAEQDYLKAKERYDEDQDLCAFYIRNSAKDKKYGAAAAKLVKKYFPMGMRKLTAEWTQTPPIFGVEVTYSDGTAEKLGVKKKMVIIGLNGYLTENKHQYNVVNALSFEQQPKLTVWDGKHYKTSALRTVNNYSGITVDDYNPMAPNSND